MLFQLDSSLQDIVLFYNGYFIYSSLAHKSTIPFKQHYYDNGHPWGINESKISQKFKTNISGPNAFMTFNNMKNLSKGAQSVRVP